MVEIKQNIDINNGRYDMAAFAISFLCGILTAGFILPDRFFIWGSLLLSIIIVYINRGNRRNFKAALLMVIFLGGIQNYSLAFDTVDKLAVLEGKTAVYECLIIDNPVEKGGYLQYTSKSLLVTHEGKHYNFREKFFVIIKVKQVFKFGDRVTVEGLCSDIAGVRNPGDFDYRLYYKSKGISKVINAESAALLEADSAGIFRTMLYLSKEKVSSTINEALPRDEAAILNGIITGDKVDIDEDTRNAYMKTGLSHILSVSGLHVGFLMLLVTYALKPFKLEKRIQDFIIISIIIYYVLLIGAPLPAVRALIMLVVLMGGKAVGRDYDLLASVSFAAFLIMFFKPLAIHDPGFMISFGAMYSIAFLYPIIYTMLRKIPLAIRSSAALSLSVWLGLAPVLAYYFNYISVIGLIINIIAVPLSFLITIAGFGGVILGIVSKVLAIYIFSVDYYLIRLLTYITQRAAELAFSGFYIPTLPVSIYLLYYLGIVLWIGFFQKAFFRIYILRFVLGYAILAAVVISIYSLPSKDFKMVFFDVGQGDSCCIITPGKRVILVDGGGSAAKGEYYYDVGGKITLPALLHQGIWRIDTVVVSHMHDDHMEGLIKVIEAYPVKNLIIPKVTAGTEDTSVNIGALLDVSRRKGVKVYKLGKGDHINLGSGVKIDFLLPGEEAKADENQNSLVGILSYKNFKALFTGDIGMETEGILARDAISASVLKVPHHGSRGSSSVKFLEEVKPKVSVISVGKNNFGHPSPEAMKRLDDSGSLIYRTDESGAVIVTTDGKSMKVRTVK